MKGKHLAVFAIAVLLVLAGVMSTERSRASDADDLLHDAWWACFSNTEFSLSGDGMQILRSYPTGFEACPEIVAEYERREKAKEPERRAQDLDTIRAFTGADQ